MELVRDRDGRPAIAMPGMGDHPTAVSLYASIVTALLHRDRTGGYGPYFFAWQRVWSAACIAAAGFAGGVTKGIELSGNFVRLPARFTDVPMTGTCSSLWCEPRSSSKPL